jgi:TonB-dependent receptor
MSRKTRRHASRSSADAARTGADRGIDKAKVAVSGGALGALAFSGSIFAADAGPATTTADANAKSGDQAGDQIQEVVVTGIRASLERALEIKQQSVGVIDAISAEDIGQFPDASIGEAIGRIPGVTVNRGSINQMAGGGAPTATGQVTGISVRGFGSQFDEVLTEGRPIASGNGQNFDFSALGAEYVGEVDVLKTPDFSLSTGAIGASVNVKFPNPFDHRGFQARAFASASDYQNDGAVRPAFGALVSDTFADDTFGVLLAGDYTDKHISGHHFDIVGWKGTTLTCDQFAAAPNGSGCTPGSKANANVPSWYIQDQAMYLERTDSRRKDGRLSLQWRPNDALLVTLDDNYSSDSEHTDRWQYSTWFNAGSFSNVTQDANGTITNFIYGPAPTDFNAFVNETYIVTNTPGINVRWDVNDKWTANFDASQSVSKLNPNGGYSSIDADVGYGNNTPVGTNPYVGGVKVSGDSNTLPYWTALGPNTNAMTGPATSANFLGLNPYLIGSHVMPNGITMNSDKVNQIKLDATWHTDDTQVHFGAQFVDDLWNAKGYDTLQDNQWQLWSGYGPASNNYYYYCQQPVTNSDNALGGKNCPKGSAQTDRTGIAVLHGVSLPSQLFTPVSVGTFMPGYNGNGNLPQSLLMYNPYAVLNYLSSQPINADWSKGNTPYNGGWPVPAINVGSVQHVDRTNYAPFVTAEHTFPIGGMNLKANLGLRYQRTDVEIAGLSAPLQSLGVLTGDLTAYQFNLGAPTWTVAHNSYNYFLPSLDLNLLVSPQFKVRADFSRTESPPANSQLIPNVSYGGRVNALSATANNPDLLPYLSDNYDLGAEWYYGQNDYLSADAFFKHVTQFPVSSIRDLTVPGVIDTAGNNKGNLAHFSESIVVNGLAANVTGVEVTWQQMLMYGFGFQVNGTYVHSNSNFDPHSTISNQFALPGIGNSANLIAFYQGHGLQARIAVQWQDEQLLALGQEQGGGAFGNEPVYLQSNTEVDFSSTYDFTSHLSGFFEALNLTDNIYHTRGRFSNQTLNIVDYGRSFTFGVRAKF